MCKLTIEFRKGYLLYFRTDRSKLLSVEAKGEGEVSSSSIRYSALFKARYMLCKRILLKVSILEKSYGSTNVLH